MITSVMIDLVIAAVLAVCMWLGAKRGLFRSLAELAVVLVALVLAARLAGYGTELILERVLRPATNAAIEQRVDELLAESGAALSPAEGLGRVIEAIPSAFIREQAESLLEELALPEEIGQRETLLELARQVADTVLDTVVRSLLQALLYLVCFVLLTVLLRLVVKVLDLPFHLPLLRQVNWLGGLLFGAVKGILLVCLGVWLLWRLELVITPETMDGSFLLPLLDRWIGFTEGKSLF